jgi:hypothetical protein
LRPTDARKASQAGYLYVIREDAMRKTCYMCERETTSDEHVPPKCLFPEQKDLPEGFDFRKNLITVPSCEEHNSKKSTDDEYLLFLLLSAAQGNGDKQRHFDTKLLRTLKRAPHILETFLKDMRPIRIQTENEEIESGAAFRVDVPRFENIVKHMAMGIYFNHYKRKWSGGFRMFTNGIFDMTSPHASEVNKTISEVASTISRAFGAEAEYGENGNIFSYKLYSEGEERHAIFMTFYEDFEITVLLQSNV